MRIKKILSAVLSAFLALLLASCGGNSSSGQVPSTENVAEAAAKAAQIAEAEYFSDSDFKDVSTEKENAVITLDGSSGTISDTTRGSSGSNVTITSKGIYRVSGSSENVSIVVNEKNKSGTVYLLLDGVTMNNSNYSCRSGG